MIRHVAAAQEIMEITRKLTKFATIDYEEYIRFIRAY